MNDIKLIALDLDGTLMSPDHLTVSEENKTALRKAHEKGIKLAISTGRTVAIIGDICEQVPEIDYVVYSNGAGVFDRGERKSIYKNEMRFKTSNDIFGYINTKPCFYEIYVDAMSYASLNRRKYFIDDLLPKEFADEIVSKMTIVDDADRLVAGKDIEKITIYSADIEVLNDIRKHYEGSNEVSVASSHPANLELTKKGVTKATALSELCNRLGITAENVMAFGDSGNDCDMLDFAKWSFAMANASEECKKHAKYETRSNAESGVAYAVTKYAL